MKLLLILAFSFLVIGCATQGIVDGTVPSSSDTTAVVIPPTSGRIPLYWENTTAPHPERKPWTDAIHTNTDKYFTMYDSAKDATRFCPKYKSLSVDLKKKAIGELLVAIAFYESGYNPKSEAVDVGTKNDKGSWSVGLYQMSGNDGAAKALKVDYLGLKDPVKNINVAMYQFNTQIKNTGLS